MSPAPARPPLAVILAAIDARATARASLARFRDELDGRGDLILVDASRDGTADVVEARFPGVRVLRRPPGRLAPELWRDGLEATDAPLVAFSTAQMVPVPGWRVALLDRLEATGAAVVGGPIEPAPGLAPWERAVYLLRYVNYLRPLGDPGRAEPPGDNAAYRRDRLSGLESLWEHGFWEVEIHRALRARGERLAMAEDAVVEFRGGTGLASLLRQRHAHARVYGASRARRFGTASRLAHIIAAPAVPAVMLRRIVAALATRGQSPVAWLPALPHLLPLLAAWSLGEARGFAEVFRRVCETHQS
jgi:glycosyl transferase family 2